MGVLICVIYEHEMEINIYTFTHLKTTKLKTRSHNRYEN